MKLTFLPILTALVSVAVKGSALPADGSVDLTEASVAAIDANPFIRIYQETYNHGFCWESTIIDTETCYQLNSYAGTVASITMSGYSYCNLFEDVNCNSFLYTFNAGTLQAVSATVESKSKAFKCFR